MTYRACLRQKLMGLMGQSKRPENPSILGMIRGGDLLLIWPCFEPQKTNVFSEHCSARKSLNFRAVRGNTF